MRKLLAFILALTCIAALFLTISLLSPSSQQRERVTIARVIDGDTFETGDKRIVRLANINAPEKGTQHASQATALLRLFESRDVEIEILKTDRYGRTLARLYAPDYINHELVATGLATKFLVSDEEQADFARVEQQAIAEQRGIWQHSPFYSCIRATIDAKAEHVTLINICSSLNITGWLLKDESRKFYLFPGLSLDSRPLTLITGKGTDTPFTLYWDTSNVWNNDRDTLYLFDAQGRIVHAQAYGYDA